MAAGFNVHPEDMGKAADELADTGQTLSRDITAFQAETAALGDAFGDDDLGSALAGIYQVASEAAFESFHDNAGRLKEIGENLRSMADEYAEIDTANQDSFQQLVGGMA
ncbi:PE domain-containing protein [Saccharopolyspora cebuensis]|uniref:PE domain-containing protein n=1 Tax=Saccharopolyspora cebuensis TaxID=418759 RepID=A0ABV4CI77_9PSEU